MEPLVSIIVNCKNGSKYLKKCLTSIKNQKFKDWEIIFFDNNSSDNSYEIFHEIKDERFRYFKSKNNETLYKARNLACNQAKGKYLAFLDTDDWWHEEFLNSRVFFLNEGSYDFFYSNTLCYIEKKNKYKKYKNYQLPSGLIYKDLAIDYFIIISGLIVKKIIFEKENYFNDIYNIIGDYDFVMRISKYSKGHAINNNLLFYRIHNENFSKLNTETFFNEYNYWYKQQEILNDEYFLENKKYFKKKLLELEINFLLLNKDKNLNLINKILDYPNIFKKLKYLIIFFLPKKIIKFLKK